MGEGTRLKERRGRYRYRYGQLAGMGSVRVIRRMGRGRGEVGRKAKLSILTETRRCADGGGATGITARAACLGVFVVVPFAVSTSAVDPSASLFSFARIFDVVGNVGMGAIRGARVAVEPERSCGHGRVELCEGSILRVELARPRVRVALHSIDLALDLSDPRLCRALDPRDQV